MFSARLMMLVSALTIESPVTTVYKIAPNAAAAMVPIAYSNASDYYPWCSWRWAAEFDTDSYYSYYFIRGAAFSRVEYLFD